MKTIQEKKTKYEVKLSSDFIPSNEILLYLYRPIIGSAASSLYMLLYTEAKNPSIGLESIERIKKLHNRTFKELHEITQRLELVGLLKIYKHVDDNEAVTLVLNKPLTINKFLKSNTLVTSLVEVIGEELFEQNVNYLKGSMFELTGEYEAFTDLNSEETIESQLFNTDSIKRLLELSDIDIDWWNSDVDKEVVQLMLVNDIDNVAMANHIKTLIETTGSFDAQKLDELITDTEIEESISEIPVSVEETIESKIKIFETLDPKEFIKLRLHRNPTVDEKKFIKDLQKVSKFPNEYINILLDYSAIKNNEVISIPYLEKIVKTIMEKEIKTVYELMEWLKTAYKVANNKEEATGFKTKKTEVVIEEIDEEFNFD